jgi:hypothetical protein
MTKRKQLIELAALVDLKVDYHNGRYSVGKSGEYFVDKEKFDTVNEAIAYVRGYMDAVHSAVKALQ